MKTNKKLWKQLRRGFEAVLLIAVVILIFRATDALEKQDVAIETGSYYQAVDEYLTKKYNGHLDGMLAKIPENLVSAMLKEAHRDYDAWRSNMQESLQRNKESWNKPSWSLVSVAEPTAEEQKRVKEALRAYSVIAGNFRIVRVSVCEDKTQQKYREFSYAVYQHGHGEGYGICAMGSATPMTETWMLPSDGEHAYAQLQFLRVLVDRKRPPSYVNPQDGRSITEWMPPEALNKYLKEHGLTREAYEAAILQRLAAFESSNAANGISYKMQLMSSGDPDFTDIRYLNCEDELPALKQVYREQFDIEIVDALTATQKYTVTTGSVKTEQSITLRSVKIGSTWYVDITDLPWPESGIFSFENINE